MSTATTTGPIADDPTLLSALLSGERFWPSEPQSLEETGLCEPFLEAMTCKSILVNGPNLGRKIASALCLPFAILEPVLSRLRSQQMITHRGSGPFNDYVYRLTDAGHRRAIGYQRECAYVGPAPVPLMDYVISVEAQAISDEPIRRTDLVDSFQDVSGQRLSTA